jgi:hypothetical protein|tara:strand:- start:497 stop:700 length:204 start_codon:yes stop_codon:yes gene_type:complete
MKNKIVSIIFIIIAISALYLVRVKYSSYNINKTIEACMVWQKKISKFNNAKEIREYCEEEIKNKVKY